ncbi:DNA translocase FtsK [Lentibacillus songyuanensis]|uniref:DNA translocase FtsK n=1 Tax=Lentibacillus songyuanensis TaxID=3136161 RepID=UPI0031BB84F0
MWEQWKKKIANLFFTEVIEEEEVERKPRDINSLHDPNVHTKVAYKYPNRNSFRFPVIPDDPQKNQDMEKPAFERQYKDRKRPAFERQNRNNNRPAFERRHKENEKPVKPIQHESVSKPNPEKQKPVNKKPFRPSEVPSPIYGFHNRKQEQAMAEIPAFVRKQQTDEQPEERMQESVPEEAQATEEMAVVDTNECDHQRIPVYEEAVTIEPLTEANESIVATASERDSYEAGPQQDPPAQEEKVLFDQPLAAERTIKTAPESNSFLKTDDQENKEFLNDIDKSPKQEQPREQQNTAKQNPISSPNGQNYHQERKRARRTTDKEANQSLPFNVMMSANDKQKYNERKQRQGTVHPIVPIQKASIPDYLLNDPEPKDSQDQLWVYNQQELLEQTLKHFHVKAKVVNATQGPSVTRFEVHPEMGVKVSKIKNLSDDLKLNMAAKDIRIEAPIPGKNTVGIEIPNPKPQMVGLQEIFSTKEFKNSSSPLSIALGLTIEGSPLITNIKKMPHGLIAGATGSGKSVCINTILISLIYKANHKDVKFLLIDPKMVELAPFNNIPHLVAPVITDVKAATQSLKWAVNEMEERYEKFVQEGVRDIERYNQKVSRQNRPQEKMPFLVIVIDELADLMMVSPQDVEDAICRIAQKARACGIHLLLATQRPSVDVITGLIKANIPTRIAFSVSSQVDSRTIIDTSGAEKLLGKGDMLFVENGAGKSVRLQGPFVSDEEIERVTKYARSIAPAEYLFEQDDLLKQVTVDEDDEDDLLEQAIAFVVQQNSASTSLLQRHFKIGYNRAARLMDTMEFKGIIAQQNGSKPREVLISNSQLSME